MFWKNVTETVTLWIAVGLFVNFFAWENILFRMDFTGVGSFLALYFCVHVGNKDNHSVLQQIVNPYYVSPRKTTRRSKPSFATEDESPPEKQYTSVKTHHDFSYAKQRKAQHQARGHQEKIQERIRQQRQQRAAL